MSSINPIDELFFLIETRGTSRAAMDRFSCIAQTLTEEQLGSRNEQNMTPLHAACSHDLPRVVHLLLEHKADPMELVMNPAAMSPLQIASQFSGPIVEDLIKFRAGVNYVNEEGDSALSIAARHGKLENVLALLQANGDPHLGKNSALYHASQARPQIPELNKLLLGLKISGRNIEELSLENQRINHLTQDPKYWRTFNVLSSLNLSGNCLNVLPSALGTVPTLRSVNLAHNPLEMLPSRIKGEPWSTIREHLRTCFLQSQNFTGRKVILVGGKGSGKTSLCHSLRNKRGRKATATTKEDLPCTLTQRTIQTRNNGSSVFLRIVSNQDRNATKLLCWDLSGREIFWSSHQFFLQSRSIFIITFNLADPHFDVLDYWVSQLKNNVPLEPNSPVLLVGTHTDLAICTAVYQAEVMSAINARYDLRSLNIIGVYFVSSETKEGINGLRTRVEDLACSQMLIRVPSSFVMLQRLLESHRALQYIHRDQFEELAAGCGVKPTDHLRVLQFLQEAGVVLHFPDHDHQVNQMIILDPEWFSSIIYALVQYCDKYQVSGGLLHREMMTGVLQPYPEQIHPVLLRIYEKFGILSRLPQRSDDYDRVLFPGSLPEEAPQEFYVPQSKTKQQLGARWVPTVPADMIEHSRVYEFRFRPLTLFDWLLTGIYFIKLKLHRYIWKHGVLLFRRENENERCLITFHHQSSSHHTQCYTLNIRSRMGAADFNNGAPNILFTEVIKLIESIIDTNFQRLTDGIRRYIPCLHCLRKGDQLLDPYQFSFEDCVRRLTSNDPFVYCFGFPLAERAVLISHMAPDIAFHGYSILAPEDLGDPKDWTYVDSGGFGKVFRSEYKGQDIAIKELLAESEGNITQDFVEFQKEVHTMSGLHHGNIVNLIGITINPLRIVSEFIHGGNLLNVLQHQPLSWEQKWRIAYDVAKGMNYLQAFTPPIIHRDLRSPNIFIETTDINAPICAKLADFGLSVQSLLSIKGSLPTWQWLAPEVISGTAEYDERADIYSYAVVLWELATDGQLPFEEFEREECFVRETICEGEAQKIVNGLKIREAVVNLHLRPSIPMSCPPEFATLIRDCWNSKPMDRPRFPAILDAIRPYVPLEVSEKPVLSGLHAPSMDIPTHVPKPSANAWRGSKTHPRIAHNVSEGTRQRWLTAPSRPKRRNTFLTDNRKPPPKPEASGSGWVTGRLAEEPPPRLRETPLGTGMTSRPNRTRRGPSIGPNVRQHELPTPMQVTLPREVTCLLIVATTLWVGTSAGEIRIYNLQKLPRKQQIDPTKDLMHAWKAHDSRVFSMIEIKYSGRDEVWTSGGDGKICVWNPLNPMQGCLWQYNERKRRVISHLVEIRDDSTLTPSSVWAISSNNDCIFVFAANERTLITRVPLPSTSLCQCIAKHLNMILVGCFQKVLIFNYRGEFLGSWEAHKESVMYILSASQHPQGLNSPDLWTAAKDNTLIQWTLKPEPSGESPFTLTMVRDRKMSQRRLTLMSLLWVPNSSEAESRPTRIPEIWTSSYEHNAIILNSSCEVMDELTFPHEQEFLRTAVQRGDYVIVGSSHRRDASEHLSGSLYIYDFTASYFPGPPTSIAPPPPPLSLPPVPLHEEPEEKADEQ